MNPFKPWYLYQPIQVLRRLRFAVRPPSNRVVDLSIPWGGAISVDATEDIGRSILHTGLYDLALSELIARLAPAGGRGIDAGANIGFMSYILGMSLGPDGHVIACEPHPMIATRLRSNLKRWTRRAEFAHVEIVQAAVSDQTGTAALFIPSNFDSNQGQASLSPNGDSRADPLAVELVTLDELVGKGQVDVLKIDVEGHELSAFRGASRALTQQQITHIVYEDHQGVDSTTSRLLAGYGYSILQFGWKLRGLVVTDASSARLVHAYQPANLLATLQPSAVYEACRPGGWRVLSASRARQAGAHALTVHFER